MIEVEIIKNKSSVFKRYGLTIIFMLVPISIFAKELGIPEAGQTGLYIGTIISLVGAIGWIINIYITDKRRQTDINQNLNSSIDEIKGDLKEISTKLDIKLSEQEKRCNERHKK